jgi:hypothetical protein
MFAEVMQWIDLGSHAREYGHDGHDHDNGHGHTHGVVDPTIATTD